MEITPDPEPSSRQLVKFLIDDDSKIESMPTLKPFWGWRSDIEPPKTLSVLRSLNNSFNIPSQENVKDNTILH